MALGRTVDELLDGMTWAELERWGKFYVLEPWGESRADARSAQVAATIANVNRDPKKRPNPFTIQEFMLFGKETADAEESSTEDGEESAEAFKEKGTKIDPQVIAWLWMKSRQKPPNMNG